MKKFLDKIDISYILTIELIISLTIASLVLFYGNSDTIGLVLPKSIIYLPLILFVILIFFFLLEFIKKRRIGRLIYFIMSIWLINLMNSSIEMLNQAIWFFSLIYTIIVLVPFTKSKTTIRKNDSKKELPVTIYSKQHLKLNNLLLFIVFVFDAGFLWIWYRELMLPMVLGLVIAFIISFVGIVYVSILINPLSKPIRLMNNEVKFNEAYELLENLKSNEMLHQDNIEYIKIFQSDYYALVDKKKSIELFENIKEPNFKEYKKVYNLLKFCYFLNKNEFENAKEQLKLIEKKHFYNKNGLKRLSIMLSISLGENVENVDLYYKTNTKMKFLNVINALNLMTYYETKGELDKAKENAKVILEHGKELTETYNKAMEIMKK